jgi:Cu/Ag efflux pump CusA
VRITDRGVAIPLGPYASIQRSLGPIQIERDQLQRAAYVSMQTEGRDIGSAAEELEQRLKTDPARAASTAASWARSI